MATAQEFLLAGEIDAAVRLHASGRLAQAEQTYRDILATHSHCAIAHVNLGNVLMDRDLPEDAFACYRRALVANPYCSLAYLNMGACLMRLGRIEGAIRCFDVVLQLPGPDAPGHWGETRPALDGFRWTATDPKA